MAKTKRGYSYEFTPRSEKDKHLQMRRVPPVLFNNFKAKCRREGISMRNVILTWVRNWVAGRRPDDDGAATDVITGTSDSQAPAQP